MSDYFLWEVVALFFSESSTSVLYFVLRHSTKSACRFLLQSLSSNFEVRDSNPRLAARWSDAFYNIILYISDFFVCGRGGWGGDEEELADWWLGWRGLELADWWREGWSWSARMLQFEG